MSRAISKDEFAEWWTHPVTLEIVRILHAKREELRQQWEGGSFTDYEKDGTILTNVGNMGTCKGYAFVTDLTYENYITELDDEREQIGPSPAGSGSAS